MVDITKNSCVLKWKEPGDTGGSSITHYVVEKMDKKDGTWKSVEEIQETSVKVLNPVAVISSKCMFAICRSVESQLQNGRY